MPAGDLISQDWQYEIRTTLMGDGSDFPLDRDRRSRFTPLGDLAYKTQTVVLNAGDGSYGGPDRKGTRVFTLPLVYVGTPANCGLAIQTMETAWAPSTTDIQFFGRLPGIGKFYLWGRPRGLSVDFANMDLGEVAFTTLFVALDPTYTEV